MKRIVIIKLEVDPLEYQDAEDTDSGTVELVEAMLRHEADLPEEVEISCSNVKKIICPW